MTRLQAAWDAFKRIPQQVSKEFPFFIDFGHGNTSTRKTSGTPYQKRLSGPKLRRFSETPVVRRLISYYRSQVIRLDWIIQPKEGKKLTQAQKKALEECSNLLRTPNPDDSWRSFLGQLIEDQLVIGWGVTEIKPQRAGAAHKYALFPVDGASLQVYTDWDGTPNLARYGQVDIYGNEMPFLNRELMVMKHNPRTNTPFGLGPVEVAANEIDYLLNAMAFAGRTASNANPKKLLWLKGMSNDQVNTIRAWWAQDVEGSGRMPIMGGDGDASSVELGLVTDQNLFLKWQEFLVAIIADAFDIDVQKVNLIVGINRSTGESLDDVTDEGAIRPLASNIEEHINQFVLPLYGLADVAEFRFRWTTSVTDRKKLSTVQQIELQMDTLTVNEARAERGLAPMLVIDPLTGKDIGTYTLSAYRAAVQRIFGVAPQADSATDTDNDGKKEGNNGVNGMKNADNAEKPMNRADEREEAS